MNTIAQLNRDVANLQKVDYYLGQIKDLHWNDPAVRQTALFIRDSFDLFEQKWRDGLQNSFFVFCIPRYAVWDGPPVFLHNPLDDDEKTQMSFENGCSQLLPDVTDRQKRMRDQRSRLLSQQNLASIDTAFHEFDKLAFSVFKIGQDGQKSGTEMEEELQQWDASLQSSVARLGLAKRFTPIFADSKNPLSQRVTEREESLAHYAETLANNPNDHMRKGDTIVNFGDHANIGILNSGMMSDIEQIKVRIKALQKDHHEVAAKLQSLVEVVECTDLETETKERALDSIATVSTELAKPEEERKDWKLIENLKKLTEMFGATGAAYEAYQKIQPILNEVIQAIHRHFPHLLP